MKITEYADETLAFYHVNFWLNHSIDDGTYLLQMIRAASSSLDDAHMSDKQFTKHRQGRINVTGAVLQRLGLAIPSEKSICGWKATPRLRALAMHRGNARLRIKMRIPKRVKRIVLSLLLLGGVRMDEGAPCDMPENVLK